MSPPSSAREALIAELMGEVSSLLDRVDALIPALNATCDAISRASADMDTSAARAEGRIAALADAARTQAIKHIARNTEHLARRTVEHETRAMRVAAQEVFRAELTPALGQLKLMLNDSCALWRARSQWWVHAVTVASSSLITWALTMYLSTP